MTRPHIMQFHCPNCKTWHTAETSFGRWLRNNRLLDSALGYYITDQDYWVHRYKTFDNRDFQLVMEIEIKLFGSDISSEQADSLHIKNQLMRNRRQTPTKPVQFQAGNSLRVFSIKNNRLILVRSYGVHVLRFSALGPDDSDWIKWDKKDITKDQLIGLLRFDLDPDTLNPLDLRNHHRTRDKVNNHLPGFEEPRA